MRFTLTAKHITLSTKQQDILSRYTTKLENIQKYLPHFLEMTIQEHAKKPHYTSTLLCTLAKHTFSVHATANTVTEVIHKGFEKLLRMIRDAKEETFHHQEQHTLLRTLGNIL